MPIRDNYRRGGLGGHIWYPPVVDSLAISSDGRLIAAAVLTKDGTAIRSWDAKSGTEKQSLVISKDRSVDRIRFSPQRQVLAVAYTESRLLNRAPGDRQPPTADEFRNKWAIDFWDLETNQLKTAIEFSRRRTFGFAYHPNAAYIAVTGGDRLVFVATEPVVRDSADTGPQ